MNASPAVSLLKTLRRLGLMSLGAVVLSSCAGGEVVNRPSLDQSEPAALQARSGGNPAVTPEKAAQPVAAEIAVAQPPTTPDDSLVALSIVPAQTAAAPDIEVGLTYIEARTRLIQQGWVPVVAPEPGPYGVERKLYDMGITEVSACSGTGVGACRFEFSHPGRANAPEGDTLSVITHGGARTEVADWELAIANAPSNAAVASRQPAEVPASFQGLWNVSLDQCAVPYSDGKLLVESNRLTFYESSGPVVEVSVQGPSEVMLTTEISGEGMTSLETYTLELSEDGSSLAVNGFARSRCS